MEKVKMLFLFLMFFKVILRWWLRMYLMSVTTAILPKLWWLLNANPPAGVKWAAYRLPPQLKIKSFFQVPHVITPWTWFGNMEYYSQCQRFAIHMKCYSEWQSFATQKGNKFTFFVSLMFSFFVRCRFSIETINVNLL